jgi:hypothetical protein
MSGTIRARFSEDRYPIGRLVLTRAQALGLSRRDLVERFGYRDLSSGHRALSTLLVTGEAPLLIAKGLAAALDLEKVLIDSALMATARQQEDEARTRMLERENAYRTSFRPHLQIQTERRVPRPIFVAALLGTERLRIVRLPDEALAGSEDDRDRIVGKIIVEHFTAQRGQVPAFGAIIGYVLVLIAGYAGTDFGLPFNVSGERAGPMQQVERLPAATLGTKRNDTRLTGLLKDAPIQVLREDA